MANQAYITLMGRSSWAVVNAFQALVTETDYRPTEIILLYETHYADGIKPVIEGLEIVQETYTLPNISQVEVSDWEALEAGRKSLELVESLKSRGFQVALDITGGRKALVAGTLLGLKDKGLDHVYYLAIDTLVGTNKPYLMIPKRIQRFIDLKTNEVQSKAVEFETKSQSVDVLLKRDCLMVLLNQAYARGEKIDVKAPLIGANLLQLDLKAGKVVMKTDLSNYNSKVQEYGFPGWDHPNYFDLRRCLIFAGVLEYNNHTDFTELLTKDISKSPELKSGARRVVLSLDSNMFYNGFPSYLEKLEQKNGILSKDVLCVTTYAVQKEISRKIKHKYRSERIRDAKEFYRKQYLDHLITEFVGQNILETRKAKMAKSQLTKFMKRPVHVNTSKVDVPKNKEEVDHLIVESLEQFAGEKGVRVTLASADKNILDQCDLANDIGGRILEHPVNIPKTMKVDDWTFVDLLVALSLLYGVIELGKIGYLFGEYKGKQSEMYMNQVKLRLRNLQRARILQEQVEERMQSDALDFFFLGPLTLGVVVLFGFIAIGAAKIF